MKQVIIEIKGAKHPSAGDVWAKIQEIGPTIDVGSAKVRSVTFDLKWGAGGRLLVVEVPAHLRVFNLVLGAGAIYDCGVGLRPVKAVYWAEPGTMPRRKQNS